MIRASDLDDSNNSRFRPGQLGLKHLLAVLAIASVVMAFAGAQLRTQPLLRIGEFFLHWLIVGVLAGSLYYVRGISLRRDRASAGDLLLQADSIHMTESKRLLGAWTMLLAAMGSAVLVSLHFLPQGLLAMLDRRPRFAFAVVFGEGLLWAICLEVWLTRAPAIEFRERGILCLGRYFRWESITRVGWSPMKNGHLVFSSGGVMHDLPIDPAVRDEVDAILKARVTGPPAEPGRPTA